MLYKHLECIVEATDEEASGSAEIVYIEVRNTTNDNCDASDESAC